MVCDSYSRIIQKNENKNKMNNHRFNNKIISFIITIYKIISLLKMWILRKEEILFFLWKKLQYSSYIFEYIMNIIIKITNIIKYSNNKIHENQKTKGRNHMKFHNEIIRKYIIINAFKLIIINIFCQIETNFLNDLFSFHHSSKITLKIKGIGDQYIFGNEILYNFTGINYLKRVYINGNEQDMIKYKYYFNETNNFVELIWDDNLNNCGFMFFRCTSIIEINLSKFNTTKIEFMDRMFAFCSSLTSIELSNFNTSKVTDMHSMFAYCSSLTSLDLSNFNTSKVILMTRMFWYCPLLSSLDLSKFNTSQVTDMQEMFQGCTNLEYINMYNFDENKLEKINYIFSNIPENIVLCLKEMKPESKIYSELINKKKCPVFDCSNDWKSRQKKQIYNKNNQCFDNCTITQQYPYEYNGKCYDQCQFGFLYDENNNKMDKCKCQLDLCLLCPNSALMKNLCTKCITNYYPKENDPLNMGEYIKCYKEPEGYYLDLDIYRQCFYTCQTCDISGNHKEHNCIKCNVNYPFKIQKYNYFNCYENCNYYYYLDNEYKYHCTKDLSCPNEYPKLNEGEIECIKYNIEDIINNLIIKERIEIEKMSKEEEIEYYDNIIKIVEIGFTGPYDTSNIDLGKDEYIITEKMIITFTTLQNQKIDIGKNMSTIDLGFCENKLRNYYNISKNETLYMKKTEVIQVGFKIPKIEFDIYSKLLGNNLIKLNITVCGESKITISIPIELTDNMDKLNSSSGYYNDICYTTTSEDGTDITLKDRKKDFIDKNMTVCQEDCEFSEYDKENNKVKCICNIEESSSSIANIKINKAKLFENFKDIKNIVNFNFLVCYKNLLKKDGIIYNIGSYIILTIINFSYIIHFNIFY